MENKTKKNFINYSNDKIILKNIHKLNCECCNKQLTIPYFKIKCNNEYHIFNSACIYKNILLRRSEIIWTGIGNENNIQTISDGYINKDELINIIHNNYNKRYIWLYASRTINKYWLYNFESSYLIEDNYIKYNNNINSNFNWKYYNNVLINKNINDDLINKIFTYLNHCQKCYKNNIKTLMICNCNKKCKKNKCNKQCNILDSLKINILNKKYIINFNTLTQNNKNNNNMNIIRKIKRINIDDLNNMIVNIQGISCLRLFKE